MAGSITPEGYLPRVVDAQVERLLGVFGAVEIAGPKWCGKTWTALCHGASASYVDESLDMARADPSLMLLGERPHVIDEWQRVPAIWDAVRRGVDRESGCRGAWILTGSSTPLPRDGERPVHSGAGRIGRVCMRPMSLYESGESTGEVSLAGLFEGRFAPCKVESDTVGLAGLVCRGGWPEAAGLSAADAQLVARDYLRLACSEGVASQGMDADVARRLVRSVARNLGQATTYQTFLSDMYGAEEHPEQLLSAPALASYLTLLGDLYLIEEVPGWVPAARSRKRMATKPKRYLADPSLAAAALGMGPEQVLADWQTFGLLFESLCMRDLAVYADALEGSAGEGLRYYRDDSRLEADAIIELADGRWAAFEVKLSEDKVPQGVESLKRLRRKLTENARARMRGPEFMAVVVGISQYAREVEEGIYVIPVRALGA